MSQTREEIRYSADATISMVYSDGQPVRAATQHDMDTLPVGADLTADDVAGLES